MKLIAYTHDVNQNKAFVYAVSWRKRKVAFLKRFGPNSKTILYLALVYCTPNPEERHKYGSHYRLAVNAQLIFL